MSDHITLLFAKNKEGTASMDIDVFIKGECLFEDCACIDYFDFAKGFAKCELIPESDHL